MYAAVLRSDDVQERATGPARQRAEGKVGLTVARFGTTTRPVRIAESGSARLRLPRAGEVLEAVLINTGGGICCGDRFSVEVEAGPLSRLAIATPAAEKVYRSDGMDAELSVRLCLSAGSELAWIPQETILYDRARVRRSVTATVAADASLLVFEAVVFGRTAAGEEVRQGFFQDRWRIHREGRLVYADTLRLSGPIAALLDRPAVAGGARAIASLLYVAPDAETRLDDTRRLLDGCTCSAGASAWSGLLAVRFLARDPSALRREAVRFLEGFRRLPLPRVWST